MTGVSPADPSPPAETTTTRLAALPLKHPSAPLLPVQILSILLSPLMEDTAVERGSVHVVGLLVPGVALCHS